MRVESLILTRSQESTIGHNSRQTCPPHLLAPCRSALSLNAMVTRSLRLNSSGEVFWSRTAEIYVLPYLMRRTTEQQEQVNRLRRRCAEQVTFDLHVQQQPEKIPGNV